MHSTAIRKKSKEENLNCKWLILLDEVVILLGKSDFSTLNLDEYDDNIELVVAVNPGGNLGSYTIIPPQDKKFITKRFTFKHRNSLENKCISSPFEEVDKINLSSY